MNASSRRLLACATVAATAAAMALPASANNRPGWYLGLHGGLNEATDADTQTDNNPGTANPTDVFEAQYDTGNLFGTKLGYLFPTGFRPELEFSIRNNDFESTQFNGNEQAAQGEVETGSLMANLWYNFRRDTSFQPYIGLGAGAAKVSIEEFANNPGGSYSDDETVGALQAGLGASVTLGARTALDVGYRYLQTEDPEIRSNNVRYDTEYGAHSLLVGLNYTFAPAAPLDKDGDGIPNKADRCPGTPAAANVGPDGCPLDTDGDSVPDYRDDCPNSAPGAKVNARGCALDSDGDGVADSADRCPNTPTGTQVAANGCPKDSDNDGVTDAKDECPNTAPGIPVNANGCPTDSDGDGVPDAIDQCPNTPSGKAVMTNGCGEKQKLVLKDVNFEFNSAKLTANAKAILGETAELLRDNPEFRVELGGHTDSVGSAEYNRSLSQKRAESVRRFLASQGIDAGRLVARGYGESQPIESNMLKAGRAENRRVEMKVIR